MLEEMVWRVCGLNFDIIVVLGKNINVFMPNVRNRLLRFNCEKIYIDNIFVLFKCVKNTC